MGPITEVRVQHMHAQIACRSVGLTAVCTDEKALIRVAPTCKEMGDLIQHWPFERKCGWLAGWLPQAYKPAVTFLTGRSERAFLKESSHSW